MTLEQYAIEEITAEMVEWLMADRQMDLKQAMSSVYNSDTYDRLNDLNTGLYGQSTAYVYDHLTHELNTGRLG